MSLSSLIVQREIATIRQVEEALARQVLYGGDLVTNLLEVAKLDEGTLTLLLAESFNIQAATLGPLPFPNDRARGLVPVDLATRWALVPLTLEGGALVVAVPEPLPREAEKEIDLALGIKIVQRIAPMVRVREALSRIYGAPLERRLQRLVARLGGQEIPGFIPSQPSMSSAATTTATRPGERARVNTLPFQPKLDDLRPPSVHAPKSTKMGFPAVHPPTHFYAPEPDASGERDSDRPTPVAGFGHDTNESPRASLIQRDAAAPPRPIRRRRGPLTVQNARKELEDALDRDAILDLFFDFARQYFDYSALFVVHGDIAEGRDAYGDGASRERVTGIGVPLDLDSVLAQAREQRAPLKLAPSRDGLDPVLLADLQRKTTGEVLVVPIIVRTRAVAIFYGDSGEAGVEPASVKEVVPFAQLVGQAFEKIIVRKKLQGFIATGGGQAGSPAKVDPASVPSKTHPVTKSPLADSLPPAPLAEQASPPSLPSPSPPPAVSPSPEPVSPEPGGREPGRAPVLPAREPPSAEDVEEESAPILLVSRRTPEPPPPPPTAVSVRRVAGPPIPREDPPEPSPVAGSVQFTPTAPGGPAFEDDLIDEDPPPSGAIAIAPRLPPSSHMMRSPALPSVIVDVDSEFGSMVDRILSQGGDDQAEAELLRQGHSAMPAIMARFPGPTTLDRTRVEEGAMRAAECGPLLRLIAGERKAALPFVLPLVGDGDVERRYWATFLLTELAYPEAVDQLVPRLFDVDNSVRRVARLAARAVGEAAPDILIDRLTKQLADPNMSSHRRVEMVDTLGELRERLAVPVLIELLGDPDEDVITAARRALVTVTRQDFAREARRWHTWWHANASRHRIEWLIDALMHDVPAMRRAAGEELKSLTKEYFGYYDDLPKRERERAQQRYRDWWTTEGRLRFRRG